MPYDWAKEQPWAPATAALDLVNDEYEDFILEESCPYEEMTIDEIVRAGAVVVHFARNW